MKHLLGRKKIKKLFDWLDEQDREEGEKPFPEFWLRYFQKFTRLSEHTCLQLGGDDNCYLCNVETMLREYREAVKK